MPTSLLGTIGQSKAIDKLVKNIVIDFGGYTPQYLFK